MYVSTTGFPDWLAVYRAGGRGIEAWPDQPSGSCKNWGKSDSFRHNSASANGLWHYSNPVTLVVIQHVLVLPDLAGYLVWVRQSFLIFSKVIYNLRKRVVFPKTLKRYTATLFYLFIYLFIYLHDLHLYLPLTQYLHYINLHYIRYMLQYHITLVKWNYSWSVYKVIVYILIVRVTNKNFVCYFHYVGYWFSRI